MTHIGEQVYDVPKKCYQCGFEWDGKSFAKQPENAPRLPGICADCIDKDDQKLREMSQPAPVAPADVELEPPRAVGGVDDEPFDRQRLASGERDE